MPLHTELKRYQVIYVFITGFVMYELNSLTQFIYSKFNGWSIEYSGVLTALVAGYTAMLKWALENSRQDTRGE